ncbi:glycosyl hydrolase family 95 catalytic domain-containing protein [Micromonospora costi]|uniref:Carbohydrate-binding protein n=1 Tax=Micromonospora costi TaxID=1530042 RepID=A0A3A9ZVP7_9ACTN|nr:carbohydrate-binding protein [Micromonospora costi]RKN52210.1 carbohydrate-binding protein [Micromonospora costi]
MKVTTPLRIALAVLLAGGLVAAAPSRPAAAAPTDAAFSASTGTLNVNRAAYLAKHDIVYNRPNTNPLHGLTVGNGRTGAMAWSANGLTMQVSGVDLSPQSTYAAGLVNLTSNPQFDTGHTTFQQRLSLYDGTLTTRYDNNRTITVLGAPHSEVMGIHVEDSRPGVTSVGLDLSLWDMNTVQNIADVPDLTTWRTLSTFADAGGVGLSRGQNDPNGFGYTLAATVEGASYTSQVVSGTRVRLSITPTSSYTVWFTAASRINAPGLNSVTQARNQLAAVKSTGYATTLNAYRAWWHDFWAKSFVHYSNAGGDADYLENVYYLATYMIAAGGYGNYPLHFINGVFRATQDNSKWSNGYWYWNQRDVYNSFLASNHTDLIAGFNRLYSRNLAALKSYTTTRYGSDGLWVPETMGWDGNARGTVNSDFVNDLYSTGTEAAYNMYLQYRYTNDEAYLRNTAYPYMREAVKFYEDMLDRDPATGRWYMASSNAHETYWDVRNAITDLAAVRLLFPLTIQVSQQLGLDAGLRANWQTIVTNLAPYQVQNGAYLPHDPPISQTRNNENVALELVWPYDQTGIGYPDQQTAVNTWNVRPHPYGNVWSNDHVHAARLGLGNQAFQGMRTMLQKYQNYPNGMTNNTNGVFEYLGIHLAAMNESLMQSYNDKIRVFPAVPTDSSFVGKFTLLAKDGFLVSSEREAGGVKYVGLKSLYGRTARVVNPWGGQEVRVRRASDNAVLTTTTAAEISFATTANTVYVVERTAKPLSTYTGTTLTGTANEGEKALSGTASALGLGGPGGGGLVNDTMLTYDSGWHHTTARGYGDYNDDTHHSTTAGAVASYTFTGTGVEYLSERFSDMGNVDVYLDNVFQTNVNLYVAGPRQAQQVVFRRTGLTTGTHTIRIVNRTTSVGMVDALRILTGSPPAGGAVALRAQANGRYVSATNAGAGNLVASATTIGGWEQFDQVDLGGGTIGLRARANNQFVCAENAGAAPLIANRATAGSWETFDLVRNADGSVSLRATVNNRYVVAENAGAEALIANRDAIGPWEKFDLVTV